MKKEKLTYKKAGVDLDAGIAITKEIGKLAKTTFNKNVLTEIGSFGGLFELSKNKYKKPVLVGSTDGVGTKVILAAMSGRVSGVGEDIVNHCVDDILVQGAYPLFFLDYIAFPKFSASIVVELLKGMSKACRENGCVLLGGETAEMPDVYHDGHFDLAGTIVGVVEKDKIIDGTKIRPGDVLIALPSSGLHTNGYSLARKAIVRDGKKDLNKVIKNGKTVADFLLEPHRSYLNIMKKILPKVSVSGMAHITGGGYNYNIVRILPEKTCAVIDTKKWDPPFIFQYIRERGNVDRKEMYDVFNMGLGLILFVREKDVSKTMTQLKANKENPRIIGHMERQANGRSVKLLY